ncbi:MAG: PIN domain-containing protein [Pirellulales bacterium]
MEWLTALHGTTVGLDTAPLIYFIEEHHKYDQILTPFFEDLDAGKFRVVTSTVTLIEVLVHPLRNNDEALARQYYDILLSSPHIDVVPVSLSVAERAAEVRANFRLKTPDAIQVAGAMMYNASALLTNDREWPRGLGVPVLLIEDLLDQLN